MKKLVSLLMVVCLFAGTCVPALAVDKTDATDDLTWVESNVTVKEVAELPDDATADLEAEVATAATDSRIIIARGCAAHVVSIEAYPALYDASTGQLGILNDLKIKGSLSVNQPTGALDCTEAQTQNVLTTFSNRVGVAANAWHVVTEYQVMTDGKGSYGKYFEFTPTGNCLNANGTFEYSLTPYTGGCRVTFPMSYLMPEDTSVRYSVGMRGGFYYYYVDTKKIVGKTVSTNVYFNDDL